MFPERLKSLRKKEAGLTQEVLAKQLGIAKSTLASYEQGKRQPDFDTLKKISTRFGVSTDYLLGTSNGDSQVPDWATEADRIDLAKLLESSTPMGYDEISWDENDKKKVQKVIEGIYWDRLKEMREKGQK